MLLSDVPINLTQSGVCRQLEWFFEHALGNRGSLCPFIQKEVYGYG